MKPLVILLLAAGLLLGAGCASDERPQQSQAADVYTCPMHPSVVSDRPGACPVCGMALVKRSEEREASAQELEHLRSVSLSPTQRLAANVATTVAKRSVLNASIEAVGIVEYAEPLQVTVSARFTGRIDRLHASTTGERIERGEPLFELYSPDLLSAEGDYLLALDAAASAPPDRSSHQRLLESSRARLSLRFGLTDGQILELERTRAVRQSATFLAPISGTVLQKLVQEGQYVAEGQELYRLADLSRVWIVLEVYEQDVRSVRVGQKVSISGAAYPGERFTGTVIFIDPVMKAETRTVRVRTEFPNPSGKLKPEMYVNASIQVPASRAIAIPSSAVLTTGSGSVVWVETGENIFEPRAVTIGMRAEAMVQVLSGLQEGERVVTSGGYLIDSESLLRVPPGQGESSGEPSQTHARGAGGSSSEANEVFITVKGSYKPDLVRVQKGRPVVLHITRNETSACSEEFVIEQFGIRARLEPFKTTTVRFTPTEAGVVRFSCGMDMLHGSIIVEETP